MARSRLAKIGTIHSRTTGLLRSGAMKEEDKPLWFDIYTACPPKDEPRFDRPKSTIPIREIFYEEDVIRAKYHNDHRVLPFVRLDDISHMTRTQKVIAAYKQLQKDGVAESELYEMAVSLTATKPVRSKIDDTNQTRVKPSVISSTEKKAEKIDIDIATIFKEG